MVPRRGLTILLVLTVWMSVIWQGVALAETTSDQQRMADSKARYDIGYMYEQAGDLMQAESYYREALTIWPDNTEAKTALQRLIDARNPQPAPPPFWEKWFSWLPSGSTGTLTSLMEGVGWILTILALGAILIKLTTQTVKLAVLKSKGIPLLGLGAFNDPTGRLPGLPHQLATDMNDAGMTIYDEKGAVPPDFNFIGDSGFTQGRALAKLLEILYTRQVSRINVDVSLDDGMLNAAVSLADSSNGYVRYLHVVSLDPNQYTGPGELTKVVAGLVADAILIALSLDPNTRGILFQRMGDWENALKEFSAAVEEARQAGRCGEYYQAHLNLGNLYSFLGLQDKSVAAYTEVAQKAKSPVTLALIQAAMACSYKNWEYTSPPDQQGTYQWLARQAIEKALASGVRTPLIDYTVACYYSLTNQIEDCVRWLREAVAGDLGYLEYVLSDPDMENFRRWLGSRTPGEAIGLRVG